MNKQFYHKLIVFVLCLAVLIPSTLTGLTAAAAKEGTVTASTLNVRSQPSLTASKVQLSDGTYVYLRKDETVSILKEEGEWYYVSLKFNGKTVEGYVHSDYVKVKNSTTPTPTPSPTPTPTPTPKPTPTPAPVSGNDKVSLGGYKYEGAVTASSLNIRSGPGTKFTALGALGKNSTVSIVGEALEDSTTTKWYIIELPDNFSAKLGYVSSQYINLKINKSIKAIVTASKINFLANSQ